MESIILLLHNEGIFFYQGSGELQHFKRFCFEKNIIGTTCRFTPKTMNLITSHFVTCLCNTLSGLQMHFTKAHPKLATYSILFMRSRASVATHRHEMSTRSIIGNHATCSRYFDVSQSIIREVCMCNIEEPQQKYRRRTVSNRLVGARVLKLVLLDPNPRP